MNSEKWRKVKSILEKALEIAPAERASFLDKACADDADLRGEVEALLDFDNTRADALEGDAFSAVLKSEDDAKNLIGERVGNYRIVGELGAGGMGAVFLAERSDGAFEQKVALKLIKRGMDSDAILRRFFNERQILASLEHPNIAHLIDGGTTDQGLPYFVLEYVEGVAITDYATRENLDLEARLKLFREVCAAVSFAHQNLVIHRDLKPSNILVTTDGKVKLLDFGIAKLLKSETSDATTATQMHIFTPEYASPEQVKGEKLTTATDVYSLGVILYELLTGVKPYRADSRNFAEIIRIVCNTEPKRPSSVVVRYSSLGVRSLTDNTKDTDKNKGQNTDDQKLKTENQRALRGDLDNIILKALRKESERRYSSVEQFAEDVRRHQTGLPVTASRDTWSYRATKFAQRNRVGVAAAGLILLTLLGGLAATLYQANVARRERMKAEQRFNDVRQLANSFLFEFHDAIQSLSGATPARKLVVSRAIEYLDKLAAESIDDAALQRELGTAYERIGKIQGNSYFSNLGDTDGAMKSYQRSLEIRQKLADADPTNRELQYDVAISERGVGDIFYTMEDLPSGLQQYENAFAILEKLVAEEPNNLKYRGSFADVTARLGDIKGMVGFANLGDTTGALEYYRRAVALTEKLVSDDPENEGYQGDYATRLIYLGKMQTAAGDRAGAIASGRQAANILESLAAANPEDAAYKSRLMIALNALRVPLLEDGQTSEAIENARRVVKTLEQMSAEDKENSHLRRNLGVGYRSLGVCLMQANDTQEAVENFRRAISISEELAAAEPKNVEHLRDAAAARQSLSEAQAARQVGWTKISAK